MTEIHLTEEEQAFIDAKLRSGVYRSAEDVVRAGLQSLARRDEEAEALRRQVQQGIDDADAGRVYEYAAASDLLTEIRTLAAQNTLSGQRAKKGNGH